MASDDKDGEAEQPACARAQGPVQARGIATRPASEKPSRRIGYFASRKAALLHDLVAIRKAWAELPVLDPRSPEEIIGYDELGLPG